MSAQCRQKLSSLRVPYMGSVVQVSSRDAFAIGRPTPARKIWLIKLLHLDGTLSVPDAYSSITHRCQKSFTIGRPECRPDPCERCAFTRSDGRNNRNR